MTWLGWCVLWLLLGVFFEVISSALEEEEVTLGGLLFYAVLMPLAFLRLCIILYELPVMDTIVLDFSKKGEDK